jgi:hypothetical protein
MVVVFFCKKIICEKCLSRLSGVGQSLSDNAFMNQAVLGPSYCHRPQSSVVKTDDREGSIFYLNRGTKGYFQGAQDFQPFRGIYSFNRSRRQPRLSMS